MYILKIFQKDGYTNITNTNEIPFEYFSKLLDTAKIYENFNIITKYYISHKESNVYYDCDKTDYDSSVYTKWKMPDTSEIKDPNYICSICDNRLQIWNPDIKMYSNCPNGCGD